MVSWRMRDFYVFGYRFHLQPMGTKSVSFNSYFPFSVRCIAELTFRAETSEQAMFNEFPRNQLGKLDFCVRLQFRTNLSCFARLIRLRGGQFALSECAKIDKTKKTSKACRLEHLREPSRLLPENFLVFPRKPPQWSGRDDVMRLKVQKQHPNKTINPEKRLKAFHS